MKRFIFVFLLLPLVIFAGERKHALVIGLDGVLPAALKVAKTPIMDSLALNGAITFKAFAGGEKGTKTEQATSSGPGWSSILTGVWIASCSRSRFVAIVFSMFIENDAGWIF